MHTIFESQHWLVSHRRDSRYAGLLIVSSKSDVSDISGLESGALSELGSVLAKTEKLLITHYDSYRVITAKLGFSAGHSCHFHVIPVSISLLEEIVSHPSYTNEPDGNDALLFVSREYCERELTTEESFIQKSTINQLRKKELTNGCSRQSAAEPSIKHFK